MSAQKLDRILVACRVGDAAGAHPIFDAAGSSLWPGRWNTGAGPLIYAGEHHSSAVPEKHVHGNGHMPPNQHWIEITVPPGVSCEMFSTAHHPGWGAEDCFVSRAYGEAWQRSRRSLLLIVPSVVARVERNLLINDSHPEARQVTHSLHQPIWWDKRLFPASDASPEVAAVKKRRTKS